MIMRILFRRDVPITRLRGVLWATGVVVLVGLTATQPGYFSAPAAPAVQVRMVRAATSVPVAQPPMMDIVPSPTIDPTAAFFSGTGDFSNGAWELPGSPASGPPETRTATR